MVLGFEGVKFLSYQINHDGPPPRWAYWVETYVCTQRAAQGSAKKRCGTTRRMYRGKKDLKERSHKEYLGCRICKGMTPHKKVGHARVKLRVQVLCCDLLFCYTVEYFGYVLIKIKYTVMQNSDQEFLEYLVKMLVDNPDDVKVNRQVDEMGVLLTLDVNAADMGKVIGRSGQYRQGDPHPSPRRGHEKQRAREPQDKRARWRPHGAPLGGAGRYGCSASSAITPEQGAASRSVDEALEDLKF